MRSSLFLTVLTLLAYSPSLFSRQLAIVIDDLGYSLLNGRRSIDLPGKVTVAILPFAPNSVGLAEYAKRKNKEVIIHLPMQAKSKTIQKTESPTLNVSMSAIAKKVAHKAGVPYVARDFFLDNVKSERSMKSIMTSAFTLSRKTGGSIIIGHPYRGTLDFLERELRNLPTDIDLVFVSELRTIDQAAAGLP